jgi:hypothetical protein
MGEDKKYVCLRDTEGEVNNLKPFTHLMVLGCSHEADQGDDKQEDAAGCDAAHNRQAGDDPRYPA